MIVRHWYKVSLERHPSGLSRGETTLHSAVVPNRRLVEKQERSLPFLVQKGLKHDRRSRCSWLQIYSRSVRSRRALAITETELRLMAVPAMIGLSNRPKNG
jgi:hypothetical protein